MRVGAAVLILFIAGSSATSSPQQQKKPKSPLSSGIDSSASGVGGGGKQSPLADDGEFLRRVMLDLVGYPPSLEQVKAFMADTNVDKRSEKIDQLLDSDEWADRTARLFCEGWFGDYHKVPIMISPKLEGGAETRIANDFVAWLKLKLSKDAPYNREIVDQIIRARGTGTGDPALLWKLACFTGGDDEPAIEFANRVSEHFPGHPPQMRPVPRPSVRQVGPEATFYTMAAFFGRTKVKGGSDAEVTETATRATLQDAGRGEQPAVHLRQKPGKPTSGWTRWRST
jgi:hypothetical protein